MTKLFYTILLLISYSLGVCANYDNLRFHSLTSNDGFPRKNCLDIEQDSVGFLWFASYNGVLRYDGYTFKEYLHNIQDTNSIRSSMISDIHQDIDGNLWFGGDFLSVYNRKNDCFENYSIYNNYNSFITAVDSDSNGKIWVSTRHGLYSFSKKTKKFSATKLLVGINKFQIKYPYVYYVASGNYAGIYNIETNDFIAEITPKHYKEIDAKDKIMYAMTVEPDGTFWFAGINTLYSFSNGDLQKINIKTDKKTLIQTIYIDEHKTAWLGTVNYGLILYDLKTNESVHFTEKSSIDFALSSETCASIFRDKDNTIWLGTHNGGVNYCNLNDVSVGYFNVNRTKNKIINSNLVSCFIQDDNENIIIGLDGGGISIVDKNMNLIKTMDITNGLISNAVTDLDKDKEGNIYIAQWHGGVTVIDKYYNVINQNILINDTLDNLNVKGILFDSQERIWMFNPSVNTAIYDFKTNEYFNSNSPGPYDTTMFYYRISDDGIEDKDGNIWFVSVNVLIRYNTDNTTSVYFTDKYDSTAISDGKILHILKDSKDQIWISTINGLNKYNDNNDSFYSFDQVFKNTGLIYAMVEDDYDFIWFSSSKGFGKFHRDSLTLTLYDKDLHMNGNDFRERAVYKTNSGEILFGSINGFIKFDPSTIIQNNSQARIVLNSFNVFNKPINFRNNPEIFNKNIELVDTIKVKYAQSVLTFSFSAMNFISPEKNRYAYFLEGFDQDWNYSKNLRNVTYTNLDPGTYKLKVKASNNEGVWNKQEKQITLIVAPPWWMTWYFRVLSLTILSLLIFMVFYLKYKRIKEINTILETEVKLRTAELQEKNEELQTQKDEIESQNIHINERNIELIEKNEEIESQREELEEKNAQLEELNKTKDKFFSIISHDLKNPMSTLMSFAELLLRYFDKYDNNKKKEFITIIFQSSKNLVSLLANLLEWSRSQSGKIEFAPKQININGIINSSVYLFKEQAKQKQIELVFDNLKNDFEIFADANMIDTIVRNLINNAIKFTPANGLIKVEIDKIENKFIQLIFIDNGVGMQPNQLNNLFKIDKTISTSGTNKETGTGLGLILCKEFVEQHSGSIWAESIVDKGTSFFVKLPIDFRSNIK